MQQFIRHPESGCLNLESQCIALGIAKKTLDKNRFKHAQKTTDYTPPKQAAWKTRFKMESWLQDCPCRVQQKPPPYRKKQATGKTRPCNVKDIVH